MSQAIYTALQIIGPLSDLESQSHRRFGCHVSTATTIRVYSGCVIKEQHIRHIQLRNDYLLYFSLKMNGKENKRYLPDICTIILYINLRFQVWLMPGLVRNSEFLLTLWTFLAVRNTSVASNFQNAHYDHQLFKVWDETSIKQTRRVPTLTALKKTQEQ